MKSLCPLILVSLLAVSSPVVIASPETFLVKAVTSPLEYEVSGVVEASRRATLSAEVSGRIEAVHVDVDDYVEAGSVVIEIRDRDYQARLDKAKAALAEANANLEDAQTEFRRIQDLRDQKLISQADYDRAQASFKSARAQAKSAEADLAEAGEQLGHTLVRAPYSGVVVERLVEPGETVSPGKKLISGYAQGELRVQARVPQSLIGQVRAHRQARIALLENERSFAASKLIVHPVADPLNHSFLVRLELGDAVQSLYPGMLVKVAFAVGETQRLLIPDRALVHRSEVSAVYVAGSNGGYSMRQVRTGNRFGEMIEILSGIDVGETIALDPIRAAIELKSRQEDLP